jgi:hypothetical protein
LARLGPSETGATVPSDKERRMLIRPLMKRRPDLAYHRQFVLMKPLTHYLQAVVFVSGAYGRYFSLAPLIFPLFSGSLDLHARRTRATLPPDRQPFEKHFSAKWLDDQEQAAREVSDVIEHEAFPCIADLASPEALDRRPDYSTDFIDPALGACFNGDFDRAERTIVEYIAYASARPPYAGRSQPFSLEAVTEAHRTHEREDWRIAYLGKLLQTDRAEVPRLLHEWEERTVKALKLDKHWTRTPFPFER